MQILSIQSSVAHGHVGNSAAVFPLQRLGAEVWPIDTVQFSNHPGYGVHTGTVSAPETIRALIDGLAVRGVLAGCDALLSGYLGDPGTGAAVLQAARLLRDANPRAVWCCDPVMGDEGPGIYVRPGIESFFRDQAVPQADVLTPNQFELARLTGLDCTTTRGLMAAIAALRGRMRADGPRIVLVTSVHTETTRAGDLDLVVAGALAHRLRTPRLPITANGAGDVIAAVFLFHLLSGRSPEEAMAKAASAVHGVLGATHRAGGRELLLIAAQAELINPSRRFEPETC